MTKTPPTCRICAAPTAFVGTKAGPLAPEPFELWRCAACGYSFVSNPWRAFERIYDEAYYHGRGADPLVDYVFELEHPRQTVRQYEWRGLLRLVGGLIPLTTATHWLDFGCGNGGLVRHCREIAGCQALGYECGWIAQRARAMGIPILDEAGLEQAHGKFDVVTAIEVLEHVEDPLTLLHQIRGLLRPGGLFFYTTGNAAPFRQRLLQWDYVNPTIHISFYEPRTMEHALHATGFRTEYRGFAPGFEDVLRFKLSKAFRIRQMALWQQCLPWHLLARLADRLRQVSAFPVGWAN